MSELAKKLRKAREKTVEVAGFRFKYRRPTDFEAARLFRDNVSTVEIAVEFVIGWDRVRECDIIDGTTTDPAEFDKDTWKEWCHDRQDFWQPLRDAIMQSYVDFAKQKQEEEKN